MNTTLMAGLGLKPEHFDAAIRCTAPGIWFEVHPENYLVEGGPRLAALEAIADSHPLSLHGVSLSLAADVRPDPGQLLRLADLVRRINPAMVSEHLAWSTWRGAYAPDLLPFPRSHAALTRIVDNVMRTQDALRRSIAVENPTHYLRIAGHDWSETDFLAELTSRSGCTLLLDINNVHISAHNLGFDANAFIDAFPGHAVTEIHLAGHSDDADPSTTLLIDSHDSPVSVAVWDLYRYATARFGSRPTLIERDGNLPDFADLLDERNVAQSILDATGEYA